MMGNFAPHYEKLPAQLPIFPLTGVLLLPQGKLPLNIFEPRYLNMTTAALKGYRMIGMIQPKVDEHGEHPEIYRTGCAGRITSFTETEDGRFLLTLSGLIRFEVESELPITQGFRVVIPNWKPFKNDFLDDDDKAINRNQILKILKSYFISKNIEANWDAIKETPTGRLVNSLAMMCPFLPSEKQALLEAPTLKTRAEIMLALLEMSVVSNDNIVNQRTN